VGFDSAYDAYLPTLVESDQLLDANGKLSAVASAAEVAGFGLAGALFQWLGGALALSVDALSFVVSAVSLLAIRRKEPEPRPEEEREPMGAALSGGLITLRNSAGLSRLVAAAGIQSLSFGVTGAVYVLFVSRTLHLAPALQGVLYALGGVASFATAGLVGRISARLPAGHLLVMASVIGLAGAAVLPAAFGPTALLVAFVVGQQVLGDGGDTLFDIGLSTLRQRHTDNVYLGRVSSVWFMLTGTGTVLGTLAGGVLAGDIGLRATLIVGVAVRLGLVALVTGKLARMHDGTALI
jgi:predicted MFS family arabinose efflux permease